LLVVFPFCNRITLYPKSTTETISTERNLSRFLSDVRPEFSRQVHHSGFRNFLVDQIQKSPNPKRKNASTYREEWLLNAVAELRPLFEKVEMPIPEKIRCAVSLTSAGTKGARKGECWPASASADSHYEIFISPDLIEPAEVLGVLVHALVHACLPDDAGHGIKFKEAATRVGLEGKMRHAMPGPILRETLERVAEAVGPLPHAKLDFSARILDRPPPADRPKKQSTRMLRAECPSCGYTVRLASKWLKVGAPRCPVHEDLKAEAVPDDEDGTQSDPPDAAIVPVASAEPIATTTV
jgi:hypothetical protein